MPFKPGESGNPLGRPKGFAGVAAKIMKATRNGDELVEFALKVFRNKPPRAKKGETAKPPYSIEDQMRAHQWLTDRSIGKALAVIDANVGGEVSSPHAALLEQMLRETHVEKDRRLAELEAKAKADAKAKDGADG